MRIITELEVYPENAPGKMTWDEANAYCEALGEGWRLPTKEELNLLYENKDELGGFGGSWLWSSSQYSYNSAWDQCFADGRQDYSYKDDSRSVRAVRDISKTLTENTDNNKLIVGNIEVYPTDAPTQMNWDEANEYCKSLGEGWRLPTKDELNLMYENLHKKGLGGFGGSWLWSSSPGSDSGGAWVQYFSNGVQDDGSKDYGSSVRACRAVTQEEMVQAVLELYRTPHIADHWHVVAANMLATWRDECVHDVMKLYNDEVVKRMDAEAERDRLREQLAAAIVINGEIPELRAGNEVLREGMRLIKESAMDRLRMDDEIISLVDYYSNRAKGGKS